MTNDKIQECMTVRNMINIHKVAPERPERDVGNLVAAYSSFVLYLRSL
jgi:hypothetical protein